MKYRKIPHIIEAVQFSSLGPQAAQDFCPSGLIEMNALGEMQMIIPTLEGAMIASDGDFIIKGIAGEFYAIKPEIFFDSYERAE